MTDLVELRNRRRRLQQIGDGVWWWRAWRDLANDAIAAAERAADQAATLTMHRDPLPPQPGSGRWVTRDSVDEPWRWSDTGELVERDLYL
jgi:hypothetical protein